MRRINDAIERVLAAGLAFLFACLICVVGFQVLSRNVLQVAMIWTPDVAQLLFSWCIFLGAALAFRKGAHYEVNVWPRGSIASLATGAFSIVAAVVVIFILVRYGAAMVSFISSRTVQSLGLSRAWYFAPIPLGAALMALFLLEHVVDLARRRRSL